MPTGLSASRLGAKWWTDFKAMSGFLVSGAPALTPAQDAQGLAFWTQVATDLVSEIQTNMMINPGTLSITPANIVDSLGHPCTGSGLVTTGVGTAT